eukprot:jgi/Picsp_1/4498/NSC_06719-R1_nadh dehydrogenase subunit 5
MYLLIVSLPLLGSLSAGFGGRYVGHRGAALITTGGLASYLLINFWFTRVQANKASIKAMVINRIGDIGLALGTFAMYMEYQSVEFATIFACAPHVHSTGIFLGMAVHWGDMACILLFIGAMGKSAQLGLHTWLPDAMEGPTPVSALIHAATMVTAGVFLLARLSPLYEYAPTALAVVSCVGAMTCIFAATTGAFQHDMKRVIAYSTASQLGYMVLACGLSQYALAVFHVANHAFFKALLFLSAGSVIHALGNEQDMRRMGGLVRLLPLSYAITLVGTLALVGWPFLTGYYSKDVILEISGGQYTSLGNFGWILASFVVFVTSYYSFRLLYLVYLVPPRASRVTMSHVHEAPFLMAFPLIVLAFGSIFVGYISRDIMIGLGTDFWGGAIYTLPQHDHMIEAEYLPQWIRLLPFFLTLGGAALSYGTCILAPQWSASFMKHTWYRRIMEFCNRRWFVDVVYNTYIGQPAMQWGYWTSFRALDRGVLEMCGPEGMSRMSVSLAQRLRTLQSGYMYHYALVMLLGVTFFVAVNSVSQVSMDPRLMGVICISGLLSPVV